MDESDSESDSGSPAVEQGPRYPLEGKFRDAADKAEILAMPEIEREQILADRADEANRDAQTRALRALLKSREQEKSSEKKRKHEDDDSDGDNRKTARQRTKIGGGRVGESSSGIETLKRARDEKADRQRRRQEDLDRNGGRRMHHDSDDHSDRDDRSRGYSEERFRDRDDRTPEAVKASPAELADIQSVQVSRTIFAKLAFYPGFEDTFTSTFARICIGIDKRTGENAYRLCEILGNYLHLACSRTHY